MIGRKKEIDYSVIDFCSLLKEYNIFLLESIDRSNSGEVIFTYSMLFINEGRKNTQRATIKVKYTQKTKLLKVNLTIKGTREDTIYLGSRDIAEDYACEIPYSTSFKTSYTGIIEAINGNIQTHLMNRGYRQVIIAQKNDPRVIVMEEILGVMTNISKIVENTLQKRYKFKREGTSGYVFKLVIIGRKNKVYYLDMNNDTWLVRMEGVEGVQAWRSYNELAYLLK